MCSNCTMRFYDKYYNEKEKFGEDKCYTHENTQNKTRLAKGPAKAIKNSFSLFFIQLHPSCAEKPNG